jgi:hypothetical protein
MTPEVLFTAALQLEGGWKVRECRFEGEPRQLLLKLDFETGKRFGCPQCGKLCPTHDTAGCHVPIAYIGAAIPMTDLIQFRSLTPHLLTPETLGSGHFSPLFVPDQINAMLSTFVSKDSLALLNSYFAFGTFVGI